MKIKLTIGLSITLISTAFSVCVNNYETRPVQEEYQSSQCVLTVKVTSKTNISDAEGFWSHQKYDLMVLKRWKGACPDKLTFLDKNDRGRFYMDVGKEYLVFIQDMKSIDIYSCCGNSGLIAEKKDVLKQLKNLSKSGKGECLAPPPHTTDL